MKHFLTATLLFAFLTVAGFSSLQAQTVYKESSKYSADVKVYAVNSKYDADLLVYEVDSKYDADAGKGLWFFADSKYDAKKKVFFVDSKYDADLLIYFVSSKYDAGWRKHGKQHLMR